MIIKSILDTDLYKFTTSYAYMKLFPQARGLTSCQMNSSQPIFGCVKLSDDAGKIEDV